MTYKVFGDYGYTSECLLEQFASRDEAIQWAERYVQAGDFGGYSLIEVAWHSPEGEYMVERRYDAVDYSQDDTSVYY
jgi:hypothetical protein